MVNQICIILGLSLVLLVVVIGIIASNVLCKMELGEPGPRGPLGPRGYPGQRGKLYCQSANIGITASGTVQDFILKNREGVGGPNAVMTDIYDLRGDLRLNVILSNRTLEDAPPPANTKMVSISFQPDSMSSEAQEDDNMMATIKCRLTNHSNLKVRTIPLYVNNTNYVSSELLQSVGRPRELIMEDTRWYGWTLCQSPQSEFVADAGQTVDFKIHLKPLFHTDIKLRSQQQQQDINGIDDGLLVPHENITSMVALPINAHVMFQVSVDTRS